MTYRCTKLKKVFLSLLLLVACSFAFIFTGCSDKKVNGPIVSNATVYDLHEYEYFGETYELGEDFYGMSLSKEFVKLTLKEDGAAELRLSVGFITGNPASQFIYTTYVGTYTETDEEVVGLFPEYDENAIHAEKDGDFIYIQLSSWMTIVAKK